MSLFKETLEGQVGVTKGSFFETFSDYSFILEKFLSLLGKCNNDGFYWKIRSASFVSE